MLFEAAKDEERKCEVNQYVNRVHFSSTLFLIICILYLYNTILMSRVTQSVQRLTTGRTVWDRIPAGTSRPALGPPSLLYNGYRVFPGGKVRRAADHSPPSGAAIMEE